MELILVVVISAGMAGNSQNGVSRSLSFLSRSTIRNELEIRATFGNVTK